MVLLYLPFATGFVLDPALEYVKFLEKSTSHPWHLAGDCDTGGSGFLGGSSLMEAAVVNQSCGSAIFRSFLVSPSHSTIERKQVTVYVESCAELGINNPDRVILASLQDSRCC